MTKVVGAAARGVALVAVAAWGFVSGFESSGVERWGVVGFAQDGSASPVASAAFDSGEKPNAAGDPSANGSGTFVVDEAAKWSENERESDEKRLRFRVDNSIRYVENERETTLDASTVFCDDLAFDFIGDNGEIVVYSFAARKFALIDPVRRLRAEIEEAEIDRFLDNIKERLREKKEKFSDFAISPEFNVSRKEDEFFFQSRWVDYRVSTSVFDEPKLADAFFQFSNALCKLNIYMNPGTVTPFARIAVNERLEAEGRFPERLVVDFYPKGKMFFNRSVQTRNEHKLARRLSERDRNRITRAIHFAAQFPAVGFRTYYEKSSRR